MKYFIAGGAGFIGSTLVHRILERNDDSSIIVYDNFSTGKIELLNDTKKNKKLTIVRGDIKDLDYLNYVIARHGYFDVLYHFASNADISKAMTDPGVDFWGGTVLTHNILEAMRINRIKKIVYASGSGVYGDYKFKRLDENASPMLPTSTYGASKLAGEALICSYCHMFDMQARIYRFANVIGKNQTHGIISDLIYKLQQNPSELTVLGDGTQCKTYVYVEDILNGIFLTEGGKEKYTYYNISSETNILVSEIVNIILEEMGLTGKTKVIYGTTPGGWKGDVPIVFLDAKKIRDKGWEYSLSSKEAVLKTAQDILGKKEKHDR